MVTGLELAKSLDINRLLVKADSKLVIGQIRGDFSTKNEVMARYQARALKVAQGFKEVVFQHIPREENDMADRLSQLATTYYEELPPGIHVEERSRPCYQEAKVKVILEEAEDWRSPIARYLQKGELPEDKMEAKKVRNRSFRYNLVKEELYKASLTGVLMRCVGDSQKKAVLEEVHEGICGSHIGGRVLAQKIMRAGFYWPTLMNDALTFVQACHSCQMLAPIPKAPVAELTAMVSPIPFSMWGIDIVGKLPVAKGKLAFVIVAVDYFTKWVEAKAVAGVTCGQVKDFLWKNIITRYGIPRILVTDNGTQFEGRPVREFCQLFKIEQRFAPVCYPQANGQVEVMNRTIFAGIKRNLVESKTQWPEELDKVLWSYRTTTSQGTKETPFSLVYGTEAVLPLEIGIPSLRVLEYDEVRNSERMAAQLEFRDELRDRAVSNILKYKQLTARFYNRRVRSRQYGQGDLVLRALKSSKPATYTKLGPKWEGPYRIRAVVGPGTYKLEHMDGKPIEHTWHAKNLRKYYS